MQTRPPYQSMCSAAGRAGTGHADHGSCFARGPRLAARYCSRRSERCCGEGTFQQSQFRDWSGGFRYKTSRRRPRYRIRCLRVQLLPAHHAQRWPKRIGDRSGCEYAWKPVVVQSGQRNSIVTPAQPFQVTKCEA